MESIKPSRNGGCHMQSLKPHLDYAKAIAHNNRSSCMHYNNRWVQNTTYDGYHHCISFFGINLLASLKEEKTNWKFLSNYTTRKKMTCASHSRKIPTTMINKKLAVQTTVPRNTKGRSRRESIACMEEMILCFRLVTISRSILVWETFGFTSGFLNL